METEQLTDTLRETLAVFKTVRRGTPLTTSEVTAALDVGRRSTYDRLERLVESGRLETKEVGARGRVWWVPMSDRETEADEDFAAALDAVDVAALGTDADGEVQWCNAAAETFFGLPRDQIVGRQRRAVVLEDLAPRVESTVEFAETVLSAGTDGDRDATTEFEVTTDGERATRRLSYRSLATKTGGRVDLFTNVADPDPDESDEQFRRLVESIGTHGVFEIGPDGRIRTWNDGAERITGYDAETVVGEPLALLYTESERDAGVPERHLDAAKTAGTTVEQGWRVGADGERFWGQVAISDLRGTDNLAVVLHDLSDRRDLLETVLESSPTGIAVFDEDGPVERYNEQFTTLLGIDSDEASAYSIGDQEVLDADGRPIPDSELPPIRALETGEPVSGGPIQIVDDDGVRWLTVDAHPTDGAVVVTVSDVTQLQIQAQRLERERDELEHELAEIFDRIDDAFFALDDEWRFTHVNDQAEGLLDQRASDLIGRRVWDAFPEASGTVFERKYRYAVEHQESVSFEAYYPPLETWFEVTAYPSDSGLSVYFRDITDRKERERELEQYETLARTASDVIVTIDTDSVIRDVNPAVEEMFGYDPDELVGESLTKLMPEHLRETHLQAIRRYLETGERHVDWDYVELPGERADGTELSLTISFSEYEHGGERYFTGIVRDISERKEIERQLEASERQFRTLTENLEEVVWMTTAEPTEFLYVNSAYEDQWGNDPEELYEDGLSFLDTVHPDDRERVREAYLALPDSDYDEVFRIVAPDGETRWLHARGVPVRDDDGTVTRIVGIVEDITDQRRRTAELRQRIRQQEVVAEIGQRALESRDVDELMAFAAEQVAETLGTDYCKILDLDEERDRLLLREGVGWDEGVVGSATVSAVEDDSQASYTLRSGSPVIVEDLSTETRFTGPALLTDHGVESGISVVIGPQDDPWGILGTHGTEQKSFSEHDVNFVQSVANSLANAISRHEDEQMLARHRERLAALNSLNRAARDITDAVIEQSTREEIEATVCERLAGTDSYLFAWIGDVDTHTQTVAMRTEAGVEGYLEDATISVDPDDERSAGPTGQALQTGEVQTAQYLFDDPAYEPWHDLAEKYNFRSSAAVPLVHEGTVYGVLNVYATRPDAFTGEEKVVIRQLGEIVGHAIAALDRKQALLSDEVIELEFRIGGFFETFDVAPPENGRIEVDSVVPIGDDEFVVYGTATDDGIDALEALQESITHWTGLTLRGDGDTRGFELRMSASPVLSTLASAGGTVEKAVIEGDNYFLTLHLPPSADARTVVQTLEDRYPSVEMLSHRQFTRADDAATTLYRVLDEALTDRQRAALQAAYHAGFFEWPRESSGEEVAETMGVSGPTFHQHLREAERKILGTALGETVE